MYKNLIEKNINRFSSKVFLIDEKEKPVTFGKIFLKPENELSFITDNDICLLLADNCKSYIELYLYFFKKNIKQILLDKNINEIQITKISKLYKPNYLIINSSNKISFKSYKFIKSYGSYNIYLYSKKKLPMHKDLAVLLSTSGSTGSSKFVKLSKKNILDNALNICKYLKINSKHTTITTMSPSYSYGMSIINTHFISGSKIILNNQSFFEKIFWDKIKRYKVNSFGGVPYHYEILKKLKFSNFNLPSLKYLTQAGGSMNKDLILYFLNCCKKKGISFIQMYGQTEASPRISYLPFKFARKKIGSIGKAIPGGNITIKKTKKTNKVGEILYNGKNVFMGYSLNFRDLSKPYSKDRMLKTGDLAWKDKDGYFFIVGRKEREIKISGLRINLDELSQMIQKKFVKFCFAEKNKKIYMFTVSNESENNILDIIHKETGLSKNFFIIKKVKSLPKNKRNKIDIDRLFKNELY